MYHKKSPVLLLGFFFKYYLTNWISIQGLVEYSDLHPAHQLELEVQIDHSG